MPFRPGPNSGVSGVRTPTRQNSVDARNEIHVEVNHYIGIDVGTGSARACIINENGDIVGLSSENIGLWQPQTGYYVSGRDRTTRKTSTDPSSSFRNNRRPTFGAASARLSTVPSPKTTSTHTRSAASASTQPALWPSSHTTPTSPSRSQDRPLTSPPTTAMWSCGSTTDLWRRRRRSTTPSTTSSVTWEAQ